MKTRNYIRIIIKNVGLSKSKITLFDDIILLSLRFLAYIPIVTSS